MEVTSHHQLEEFMKSPKKTGEAIPYVPANSQNHPLWIPSWLGECITTRKDRTSEGLAGDKLETNPITLKPETVITWQSSSPGFPFSPVLHLRTPSQGSLSPVNMSVPLDSTVLSFRQASGPQRGSPPCNSSLCHPVGPCCLFILYLIICIS